MRFELFFCVALGAVNVAAAEEARVLKFDLEVGKEYEMSQVAEVDMRMKNPMAQEAMNVLSTTTIEYTTEVEADPKGEKVTVILDRFAMKTATAGMNMEYDSADEATHSGPMAAVMKGIVGMESGVIFDDDGKVVESFSGETAAASKQLGVTSEQFMEAIGQSLKMFPEHAIKVGDTWEIDTKMSLGGITEDPMAVKTTYKLEGYEELGGKEHAKITFNAAMDGSVEMGGMAMTLKSEKFEGVLFHDTQLNVMRKMESEIDMLMSVPEGAEIGAGGLGNIPYSMKVTQELINVE